MLSGQETPAGWSLRVFSFRAMYLWLAIGTKSETVVYVATFGGLFHQAGRQTGFTYGKPTEKKKKNEEALPPGFSLGHAPLGHFMHGLCLETRQKSMSLHSEHRVLLAGVLLRWLCRIFHQNGNLCASGTRFPRRGSSVKFLTFCRRSISGFGVMVLFAKAQCGNCFTIWIGAAFFCCCCRSPSLRQIAIALYLADTWRWPLTATNDSAASKFEITWLLRPTLAIVTATVRKRFTTV